MNYLSNILLLCFALTPLVLSAQNATNPANPTPVETPQMYCPFPASQDDRLEYEVRRAGSPIGALTTIVTSVETRTFSEDKFRPEAAYLADSHKYQLVTIEVDAAYRGQRFTRRILKDYSTAYIYESDRRIIPFLMTYLRPGLNTGGMLVTSVQNREWQGETRGEARLMSLDGKREERYLNEVGLSYMRNGDLEYILKDSKVKPCPL
ncbi:MAG: hypothetical protein NXI24_10760 [bacterium]|nr:hypothetical protein [bacterium]